MKLECTALAGHRRLCSVGYPVFHALAKVGEWDPPGTPLVTHPTADSPTCPQVSFTLELEFSCSLLLGQAEVALQASR